MDSNFSDRIADVPTSFLREILKTALQPEVISFAGGLPARELFPADELEAATAKVFAARGRDVLQYGNSEGDSGLREYISAQYKRRLGLDIPADSILITSGSQQGLDLLGKTLLNDGDGVLIEEPGYLGAIQAFAIYRSKFLPVPVKEGGMDTDVLRKQLSSEKPKLMYTVPNFQNPSGVTYSEENRQAVAEILKDSGTLLIEDDPYGALRYTGQDKSSFKKYLPESTILLGSFSKVIVPGFRLGWIVAPESLMQKLVIAKQATDLHTSHFTQAIIAQYLLDNDLEAHIAKIKTVYGERCRLMQECIREHFPKGVAYTRPEGGMFLWVELPQGTAALDLFDLALKDKVVFVPGDPFYIKQTRMNTMRLNFSCVDEETIRVGIERLGKAIHKLLGA